MSADFESDKGHIRVRPNMAWDNNKKPTNELAYVTIFTTTSKININSDDVRELIEMLEGLEGRYITKTE